MSDARTPTAHVHAAADITSGNLAIARGGTGVTTGTGLVPVVPSSVTVGSGSASVGTNGLVTFTSASSVLLNGVFSATYKNYVIYWSAPTGNTNGPSANVVYVRFATGGTVNSSSSYTYTGAYSQTTSFATTGRGTGTNTNVAVLDYAQDSCITLYAPFETRGTSAIFQNGYAATYIFGQLGFNASTSFDGIQFFNNTYTGTVQVYGLRN